MSRTGKKKIAVNSSVEVSIDELLVSIKGKFGHKSVYIPEGLKINYDQGTLCILKCEKLKQSNIDSLWGTTRQNLNNAVLGVSIGFQKTLLMEGVGYRAQIDKDSLILYLGYSHNINYLIPKDLTVTLETPTRMVLFSHDKELLGQCAAEIKSFRPPEPYKGKGIRFLNEEILRKVGKSGKK